MAGKYTMVKCNGKLTGHTPLVLFLKNIILYYIILYYIILYNINIPSHPIISHPTKCWLINIHMDSTNQLHDMNKQQLGTLIANQQKLGTSRDIYRTWQVNIIQSDIQHAWMYMNCSSDFLAGMQPRLGMECNIWMSFGGCVCQTSNRYPPTLA